MSIYTYWVYIYTYHTYVIYREIGERQALPESGLMSVFFFLHASWDCVHLETPIKRMSALRTHSFTENSTWDVFHRSGTAWCVEDVLTFSSSIIRSLFFLFVAPPPALCRQAQPHPAPSASVPIKQPFALLQAPPRPHNSDLSCKPFFFHIEQRCTQQIGHTNREYQ